MEEERKEVVETEEVQEVEENLVDDGKVHFPVAGLIIIGTISLLMIICFVIILVVRK